MTRVKLINAVVDALESQDLLVYDKKTHGNILISESDSTLEKMLKRLTFKKEENMKVDISCCGNPDHGEYKPPAPSLGLVSVDSLEDASDACRAYIIDNSLGAGNWSRGDVYDEEDTKIARICYNGKIKEEH